MKKQQHVFDQWESLEMPLDDLWDCLQIGGQQTVIRGNGFMDTLVLQFGNR